MSLFDLILWLNFPFAFWFPLVRLYPTRFTIIVALVLKLYNNFLTWWFGSFHTPVALPGEPTYLPSRDVSLVVPTVDTPESFPRSLQTWAANRPKEIIIVTVPHELERVRALVAAANIDPGTVPVKILINPRATKRGQMARGIRHSTGSIVALSDDDTYWPPTALQHLLAPFEDPTVGGVGGRQKAAPPPEGRDKWNVWEAAAAQRLWRRGLYETSNNAIDGGCMVLSGRTVLYRGAILRDAGLLQAFTQDYWMGRYLLDSGDDTFLTRWVQAHGWDIRFQSAPEADILTVVKDSSAFAKQCIRWHRNTLRTSTRTALFVPELMSKPYLATQVIFHLLKPLNGAAKIIGLFFYLFSLQSSAFQENQELRNILFWTSIGVKLLYDAAFLFYHPHARTLANFLGFHVFQKLYEFQSPYCLFTINETKWLARDINPKEEVKDEAPEIIMSPTFRERPNLGPIPLSWYQLWKTSPYSRARHIATVL